MTPRSVGFDLIGLIIYDTFRGIDMGPSNAVNALVTIILNIDIIMHLHDSHNHSGMDSE